MKRTKEILEARAKIREIKSGTPKVPEFVIQDTKPWRHCRQHYLHHFCEQYGFSINEFLAISSVVQDYTVLEHNYLKRTDVSPEKQFLQVLWEFKKLLKKGDALTIRKISGNSYLRHHNDFHKWLASGEFHINGNRRTSNF